MGWWSKVKNKAKAAAKAVKAVDSLGDVGKLAQSAVKEYSKYPETLMSLGGRVSIVNDAYEAARGLNYKDPVGSYKRYAKAAGKVVSLVSSAEGAISSVTGLVDAAGSLDLSHLSIDQITSLGKKAKATAKTVKGIASQARGGVIEAKSSASVPLTLGSASQKRTQQLGRNTSSAVTRTAGGVAPAAHGGGLIDALLSLLGL